MTLKGYYFVLDTDGNPVGEDDIDAWSQWHHENHETRCVLKQTTLAGRRVLRRRRRDEEEVMVSTIFTAVNYAVIYGGTAPLLWETMIFGGPHDLAQWRYPTRAQALAHHDQVVAALRASAEPTDPGGVQ